MGTLKRRVGHIAVNELRIVHRATVQIGAGEVATIQLAANARLIHDRCPAIKKEGVSLQPGGRDNRTGECAE